MLNDESPVPPRESPLRRLIAWSRHHPWKTAAILLCLLLLEQVVTLPFADVSALATRNPGTTALMEERAAVLRSEGKKFRTMQHWTSLNKISPDLVNAVIVAEDGTFWSHHGFDWFELKESVQKDIEEGRAARGASTISQQLVKNLFLSSSKNPFRKMKEWILTWWMETQLKKSRILEIYLNVIEWGNGVYGAEAASVDYFGKSADTLTREEAARLAAIIPSPRRHEADADLPYVLRRAELILERMSARGY